MDRPTIVGHYLGDGPRGPVLFREERPRTEPDHGTAESIGMLSSPPLDPDYRTYWPQGFFRGAFVNLDAGRIEVYLRDPSMADRPAGISPQEAALSVQQVVYNLQAYAGLALPVRFLVGERPVDRLFGVSVVEPVTAAPVLETLSLMSVVTPAEGEVVKGSFRATGFNNGYESTAAWQLWRGDELVKDGATIAAGHGGDQLFSWHFRVHVGDLPPGTYTFIASNDEPTDGVAADTDTRTVVVE